MLIVVAILASEQNKNSYVVCYRFASFTNYYTKKAKQNMNHSDSASHRILRKMGLEPVMLMPINIDEIGASVNSGQILGQILFFDSISLLYKELTNMSIIIKLPHLLFMGDFLFWLLTLCNYMIK